MTALCFAVFKTHLPKHINSTIFTDSCPCPRLDFFLSRQILFNHCDGNVFHASQPQRRCQKEAYVNVGIPVGSTVSILVNGDVSNLSVSVQYFSHVDMDMLFLFDCLRLVVEATCRCLPDSGNEHFP